MVSYQHEMTLFVITKIPKAYMTLFTRKQCQLNTPVWKEFPFAGRARTSFDLLIDAMLNTSYFSPRKSVPIFRASFNTPVATRHPLSTRLFPVDNASQILGCTRIWRLFEPIFELVNEAPPEPLSPAQTDPGTPAYEDYRICWSNCLYHTIRHCKRYLR